MKISFKLIAGFIIVSFLACKAQKTAIEPLQSTRNPLTSLYDREQVPTWIEKLPWSSVINIASFAEKNDDLRLATAQKALAGKGGVIYFPAGTYNFESDINLENGVILRGESPKLFKAVDEQYVLSTRFEFPKYHSSMVGNGTPNETAFRSITVANPSTTSNCGVINIAINRGSIRFDEGSEHKTGNNRVIFGCILTNTASIDRTIPNKDYHQTPNQRFTARHEAAINAYSAENLFIANNRIPKSGDDNFLVKPYTMVKVDGNGQDFNIKTSTKKYQFIQAPNGIIFDYDNRPGIYANNYAIGAVGNGLPNGTPEAYPYGFRKGTIIRDNYIYCSGRSAIAFSGDGVNCSFNIIRFPEGLERPTTTGLVASDQSSTNDNRAITMRGYRWYIEGNDYEVHSNMILGGIGKINDGEGIMHENHLNSAIIDGKIINNTGNKYICLWRMNINGVLIKGNKITTTERWAINILSLGRDVKDLKIIDNIIGAGNINVAPFRGGSIQIKGNKYTGSGTSVIEVTNPAWVNEENINFSIKQVEPK